MSNNGTGSNFHSQILIHTQIINSDFLIVKIHDNTTGINEQVKLRIFEPFLRNQPIAKGTGLELSISYKIVVERHQGFIWYEQK
ncbi:ATP-binding protein [Trichormus azollae]|uniref:ATP-binding protein n=1 Tax=Trichormus azollae TaxID=1164 RepID=UPI003D3559C6